MSKGSKPRPIEVSSQTYTDNWEKTFGKLKICAATIIGCEHLKCVADAEGNCKLPSQMEYDYRTSVR